MMRRLKHHRWLLRHGVSRVELREWSEIDPDVARLMIASGVGLDSYRTMREQGISDYESMADAILNGADVVQIRDAKRAALRTSDWDNISDSYRSGE